MSGTRWQYRDVGSGCGGHMQLVADNRTYNRVQAAQRAYLEHLSTCRDCGWGEVKCDKAKQLRQEYEAAEGSRG